MAPPSPRPGTVFPLHRAPSGVSSSDRTHRRSLSSVPLAFGWRHLCYVHWRVDPDRIEPHLPAALAPQPIDGTAWLSAVALRAVRTRPRGAPALLGPSFAQVNLRTYVTADGDPGVYFFSLDAGSVLAVLGGRLLHRLPYHYATTTLRWRDGRAHVGSRRRHPGARPARYVATVEPDGDPFEPAADSVAAALTARERLYTESSDGRLRTTRVDHAPIRLRPAVATVDANTLVAASGLPSPDRPARCYYGPGVDVTTTGSVPRDDRVG